MRKLLPSVILSALLTTALAGSAGPAPVRLSSQTWAFTCQGNQSVQVSYVNTAAGTSPMFLLLTYKGQRYGLAQAVSASGARYIGHAGLNTASGLEWWEHQGEGTLSRFSGDNASITTPVLTCKLSR